MISIRPTVGIIFSLCSILLVLEFTIPLLYPYGTFIGLDGMAGRIDHAGLWDSMDLVSGFLYGLGDYCCHQMESRTLVINGNELFICIRETSLILGLCIGLSVILMMGEKALKGRGILCLMVLLFFASPLEWVLEGLIVVDTPIIRFLCSVITGVVVSYLLSRFLQLECDLIEGRLHRDG